MEVRWARGVRALRLLIDNGLGVVIIIHDRPKAGHGGGGGANGVVVCCGEVDNFGIQDKASSP